MNLTAILSADRVVSGTAANSKKKALEALSHLLSSAVPGLNQAEVFSSLTTRERLGSTGLGHGVGIPHGRITGIKDSIAAFVRLKHSVDYDANDGDPVDLVFGLLVPQGAGKEDLAHLSEMAELFSDSEFCNQLRAAQDSTVLYELLCASAR